MAKAKVTFVYFTNDAGDKDLVLSKGTSQLVYIKFGQMPVI